MGIGSSSSGGGAGRGLRPLTSGSGLRLGGGRSSRRLLTPPPLVAAGWAGGGLRALGGGACSSSKVPMSSVCCDRGTWGSSSSDNTSMTSAVRRWLRRAISARGAAGVATGGFFFLNDRVGAFEEEPGGDRGRSTQCISSRHAAGRSGAGRASAPGARGSASRLAWLRVEFTSAASPPAANALESPAGSFRRAGCVGVCASGPLDSDATGCCAGRSPPFRLDEGGK